MKIREVRDALSCRLAPAVGSAEARAMANIIIEDIKGYTPTQMVMYADRELLDATVQRMLSIADKVVDGQPLQYVIGSARFRGRDFLVDPSVLIPRPETGQLVDMIVDVYGKKSDLRVLDLGTGSGCIAVSLAIDLPFADVTAVDISPEALKIANDNAKRLNAKISTVNADIYDLPDMGTHDIIVSNPPYILQSEAHDMESRVKDYEPAGALFVPDDRPIAIYQAIADYSCTHLARGGSLYLEINPLTAQAIKEMLTARFENVQLIRDFKGNLRFAIASALA